MAGERRVRGEPAATGDEGFWATVLPDTALGLATLLFFMAVAAAFSGAALFAYYRFELDDTRERVAEVEGSIASQVESGTQIIDQRTDTATAEIEELLQELEQFAASGQTVEELVAGAGPSMFLVSTLDEAGQPSVGTAFVLFSDSERSFLLTSHNTIRALTVDPGPGLEVRQGDRTIDARLTAWDEARDLALLVAEEDPNLPAIEVADPSSIEVGDRVFAVSALGTAGGALTQGVVADVAANGIQHDAPVGPQFQGGPLLDAEGKLVGITSRRYAPLGFIPDSVFFAVPVREACVELVQCPAELD
ncbi:MAG TPA: S1C family serine protease [Acidimicrobiales bacterium]|nr:S1C family serine protease [Acidimicrobiales bacterium]